MREMRGGIASSHLLIKSQRKVGFINVNAAIIRGSFGFLLMGGYTEKQANIQAKTNSEKKYKK